MKAIFISDIHSRADLVSAVAERVKRRGIGLAVICGDITNEGSKAIAEEILGFLDFRRVLAVPGNMDSKEVLELLEREDANLHKKCVNVEGISFIGLGGAKPVNTFYRFNLGELEAQKYLEKLFTGVQGKIVLVSHSPPAGTAISTTHAGIDLGVCAIKTAIEKFQPEFCVCGHVHEAKGETVIGKTRCINIGALIDGNAVIIDFDSGKLEWIDLNDE